MRRSQPRLAAPRAHEANRQANHMGKAGGGHKQKGASRRCLRPANRNCSAVVMQVLPQLITTPLLWGMRSCKGGATQPGD